VRFGSFPHPRQPIERALVDVHVVRDQILRLPKPLRSDEIDIVARIVGHHEYRRGIEAIHQQPAFIVGGWIHRPEDAPRALLPRPGIDRLEQSPANSASLRHSKKPKKTALSF